MAKIPVPYHSLHGHTGGMAQVEAQVASEAVGTTVTIKRVSQRAPAQGASTTVAAPKCADCGMSARLSTTGTPSGVYPTMTPS